MLKDNVNKLISNSGFSIRKIAEFTGLPYATLYKITTGYQVNPTVLTLIKLASYFGVSLETLVYGEVDQAVPLIDKKPFKLKIPNYTTVLSQKLAALCNDAGWNLADLTRVSGLPRSTLQSLLKRPARKDVKLFRSAKLSTVAPLSKLFHITLDELIGF